jgi:hypothetical protein
VAAAHLDEGRPELIGDSLGHDLPSVLGGQDDVGMQSIDHMAPVAPLPRYTCHQVMIHLSDSLSS